jgi:hypothetical protein
MRIRQPFTTRHGMADGLGQSHYLAVESHWLYDMMI